MSDISTSQEATRIAVNHQKVEEARKDSFLEPLEGIWPYQHFDFGLLASRILGE